MKRILKIEGMMCGHCVATVKKALENVKGISSAEVSHEKGVAIVNVSRNTDDGALKAAVENAGYTVTAVEN